MAWTKYKCYSHNDHKHSLVQRNWVYENKNSPKKLNNLQCFYIKICSLRGQHYSNVYKSESWENKIDKSQYELRQTVTNMRPCS